MRGLLLSLIGLWLCAGTAGAEALPGCSDADLATAREVSQEALETQAAKPFGSVTVAPGQLAVFGFKARFMVDEHGRVACLDARDEIPFQDSQFTATPERSAFFTALSSHPFAPFVENDQPYQAFGVIWVPEEERPAYHVVAPNGDMSAAKIEIERHDHHNSPFVLTVGGDGTVGYQPSHGDGIGDIIGVQSYRLSPEQMALMLDAAETAGFWSWRDEYWPDYPGDFKMPKDGHAGFYDRISITFGGRTKTVRTYLGGGAPFAFAPLFDELSHRTKADVWWDIDNAMINQLTENGFDFTSEKSGELLIRAAWNIHVSQETVDRLIALGAPQTAIERGWDFDTSLLDAAIVGKRAGMRDRLLAEGALLKHGKPDRGRATRALMAAVETASPDSVAKILTYKPDLYILPKRRDYRSRDAKPIPLITLLWHVHDSPLSDRISVIEQLIDAGADINSRDEDGESLLDKIVYRGNDPLADWLIAHGAVQSTDTTFDLRPNVKPDRP